MHVPGVEPYAPHQLSVEAWIHSPDQRLEAVQALVSRWRSPDRWPGFAAFDAAATADLPSHGYFGAVFDGRYVYGVPEQHGTPGFPTHGVVLRYDTHSDFYDRASYAAHDAAGTDGLDTRGYYGGAYDGHYVYFLPRQLNVERYHSCLLLLDPQGDFHDPRSWAAQDIGLAQSAQSAAFDGRFLYFCPGFRGSPRIEDQHCGRVIRFDTRADFKSLGSYSSVDITTWLGPRAACFDGAAFDGRHLYFVPLYSAIVVQYDTQAPFAEAGSWQSYDARAHGMSENVGAVFDGTHLYFCAYDSGRIIRYDTRRDFTAPDAWESFNADPTDGLHTAGFDGGFFDGRFVYFQPFFQLGSNGPRDFQFHSRYLRYNPALPFQDPQSWRAFDASRTDGLPSVGYNGGAFDGRYFYAAPWQQGPKPGRPGEIITHGIVLRCDTLGNAGSFSLRWCDCGHNGGLNAGVIGPRFLINTDRGARSVMLHHLPAPGRHHVVGVYDGSVLTLYLNGLQAARTSASGALVHTTSPVTLGRLRDGQGALRGQMLSAHVEASVWSAAQVRARFAAGVPQ